MAIENAPYWVFTATLRDRDNNTSQMSLNLPDDVVLDDVVTAISGSFATLLSGISDAVLVGYSLTRTGEDVAAVVAPETSDVERKGVFVSKADNGQTHRVEVPSIKNTLVVDGTNVINTADTGVAAFISFLTTGILGFGAPVTNTGSGIASLKSARKMHRGSSKG